LKIEVSRRNYRRLDELKRKTNAESLDEVVDWLLDFWYSWAERKRGSRQVGFGYDV
jgi:hypothetical protein